jgi:hypothetical protein
MIFWCGPTREQSGWGEASSRGLLHCPPCRRGRRRLPARPFGRARYRTEPLLAELEAKSPRGADVVWQHLPPHLMEPTEKVPTAGMFAYESSHFRQTGLGPDAEPLDGVIVFCQANRQACEESGVRVPVHVVPHAVNTERYCRSAPSPEGPPAPEGRGAVPVLHPLRVARPQEPVLPRPRLLPRVRHERAGRPGRQGGQAGRPADHLRAEVGQPRPGPRPKSGIRKRFRREPS